ncbi:hypothetical protein I3843_14G116100 [Carya illinoinensis]|nr:hypothetical protein I3843_14G116100 [Carya illinoinensis]
MSSNQEDHFDRLPDAILLLIFNKLLEAETLIRCLSVSKRFAYLIPQVDAIFLPLPLHVPNPKLRQVLPIKFLKIFVHKLIIKPIQFLHQIISARHASNFKSDHFLYYSPNEVLKNFNGVKTLHLKLPYIDCEMGFNSDDSLLKWKAKFGEELKSCIILGATSFQKGTFSSRTNGKEREEEGEEEFLHPYLAGEELKSRIMWTISCLVSASVRHYLLKQIVAECPALQRVVITDTRKQGKLRMVEDQIVELRNTLKGTLLESSLERTPIPKLRMKLWYKQVMELPASGFAMKGVTVMIIKPAGRETKGKSDGDLLVGGLDGEDEEKAVFGEAVREMVKRKPMFVMEMSSF